MPWYLLMMRRYLLFLFFAVAVFLSGCSKKDLNISGLSMLEGGKTIAVPTGTVADQLALKRFPDAKIVYYNNVYDCALAVSSGKADGAVYDRPVLKNIAAKSEGLTVLDENLLPDRYGFAVAMDNIDLKKAIDETLDQLKQSGLYDDMLSRWLPEQGKPLPMPALDNEGPAGVLYFGTAAVTEPMAFMDSNQRIVGFDIEFAQRIANHLNKQLKIVNMEFGAMMPALFSGKVDMIGAGLSITEERAKSVLFSESYYESGIAVLVKSSSEKKSPPAAQNAQPVEETWAVIGVLMGSVHEVYAIKNYPGKQIQYFNTIPDMLMALNSGKIDAAFMDQSGVREVFSANKDFSVLKKNLFTVDIGAGFHQQADELREQFNRFLKEIKANGIYDEMVKRWMEDTIAVMPEIQMSDQKGLIRIGIVSDLGLPFVARSEGQWRGFDVELDSRFAAWSGKRAEWVDMPFGSLLPSLISGKVDMITSSIMITDERKKSIDFSDPYYASGVSIIGKKSRGEYLNIGKLSVLDDIAGKKVGILTGTVHDAFIARKYPEAEVYHYESSADMIMSLKSGKIDAAMFERIAAGLALKQNPDLGLLTDDVLDMPLGVGFQKEDTALLADFNAFLKEIREDGTFDRMHQRWFVQDPEKAIMPDFKEQPAGKKIVVGIAVDDLPYVAFMNGQYVGFDIEMVRTFAARRGYDLELVILEFPSLVPALAAGKVDMITDGIAISEERAKQINFSDEYAVFRTAVVALKKNLAVHSDQTAPVAEKSFFAKLTESFRNNIIHEKRYLIILKGLLITIVISILAALTGTILGGVVCSMRMSKNKLMRVSASYYISLIRGTPVLVLLMIIYYIVFASVNISPIIVAVIAFGINFAAYVSEMFRTGIQSVDKGQKEAGIASGFTKVQTFIYIIMPQALRQVLPVYKGEFVSLVKMTSVVGYIAVEDLTKASDIIRSRTFDAFFPLIMAAIVYITIAWLLTRVLDHIEISVDPKKRRLTFKKEALP